MNNNIYSINTVFKFPFHTLNEYAKSRTINLKDYEERFVVNPFIPHFKDVNNLHKYLYRTGDLGKC